MYNLVDKKCVYIVCNSLTDTACDYNVNIVNN